MRSVIISCVILILIIIMIIGSMIFVSHITANITQSIVPLEYAIKAGDSYKIKKQFDMSHELWEKNTVYYEVLYEHDEIDLIQTSFSKMDGYIKTKKYDDAYVELTLIKTLINHLPAKDRFTWNNLL